MNNIFVTCPHCSDFILIEHINCAIFRHAILKSNGQQINPHETEENCNYLIKNNLIFGCGKPFRIITNDTNDISKTNDIKYIAVICDYI